MPHNQRSYTERREETGYEEQVRAMPETVMRLEALI